MQAGHGCIGCSEPDFWDTMGPFEEPMADRLFNTVLGLGADNVSDKIGIGVLALAGIGIAAHAAISIFAKDKEEA